MRRFLGAGLLVGCVAVVQAETGAMEPGRWRYTMETVIPGVPFPLGAVTQSMCLSAEDAKYGVLGVSDGRKGDCRYESWTRSAGVTRYTMVCPGNDDLSGHFEFTSDGTTTRGEGVIRSGSSEMVQRWTGERIGDCDAQ
jgi:hypothetical protein